MIRIASSVKGNWMNDEQAERMINALERIAGSMEGMEIELESVERMLGLVVGRDENMMGNSIHYIMTHDIGD